MLSRLTRAVRVGVLPATIGLFTLNVGAPSVHAALTTSASLFGGSPYRTHDTGTGVVTSNTANSGGTSGQGGGNSVSFVSGTMPDGSAFSSADSEADLTTGKLKSTTTTQDFFGQAQTTQTIGDVVHFHIANADANTQALVTIDLRVTGTISDAYAFHSEYDYSLTRTAGAGSTGVALRWLAIYDDTPGPSANDYADWFPGSSPLGWTTSSLISGTPEEFHFYGTMTLQGADSTYLLSNSFSVRTSGGTDADFGHTAQFSFQLPQDVTFTSDSGLLLTAPEPGSCGIIVVIAMTGLAQRGRRSSCRFGSPKGMHIELGSLKIQ